ncbi:MAG: O-antigen ligase family protein [Calditrichaeota bacterium]|nr:O-antigen ligase family protein [Calditrichota bacterium]
MTLSIGIRPFLIAVPFILALSLTAGLAVEDSSYGVLPALFIAGIAFLVSLSHFKTYVMLFLPLMFLSSESYVFHGFAFLLLLSFVLTWLREGRLELYFPYWGALLLLFPLSVVAFMRAEQFLHARTSLLFSLYYPLAVFIFLQNTDWQRREIKFVLRYITAIFALVGYFSLGYYLTAGLERIAFGWSSYNLVAAAYGLVLPLALLETVYAQQASHRIANLLISAGIFIGLLVTQTRAIMLATLIAIAYIARFDRKVLRLFLPLVIAALIAMPTLIFERMSMLLGRGVIADWSAVGRIEVWMNSAGLIADNWFWGIGLESFRKIYIEMFPKSLTMGIHIHNMYLKWLLDYGIIALLLLTYMILSMLRRAHGWLKTASKEADPSRRRMVLAINGAIVALMVASLVDAYVSGLTAVLLFALLGFQSRLMANDSLAGEPQT